MMKLYTDWRKSILPLLVAVLLISCDNEESPSENPQEFIQKTWQIGSGSIKQDGMDVTSEYPSLSVTFKSNGTYSTLGGKKLFRPTGTWTWQDDGVTTVLIDGDHAVTVKEITKETLHVQFDMTEEDVNANGRAEAVVGTYEIIFASN